MLATPTCKSVLHREVADDAGRWYDADRPATLGEMWP
jgi:hypothetical protein